MSLAIGESLFPTARTSMDSYNGLTLERHSQTSYPDRFLGAHLDLSRAVRPRAASDRRHSHRTWLRLSCARKHKEGLELDWTPRIVFKEILSVSMAADGTGRRIAPGALK